MSKEALLRYPIMILVGAMVFLSGMSLWAGYRGWWLPKPESDPPSIREGSVRTPDGKTRTRYFIGGGFVGGK